MEKQKKEFYDSKVYSFLEQEDTKLWHLSALTLFHMFDEKKRSVHSHSRMRHDYE